MKIARPPSSHAGGGGLYASISSRPSISRAGHACKLHLLGIPNMYGNKCVRAAEVARPSLEFRIRGLVHILVSWLTREEDPSHILSSFGSLMP